jgi:hypothetical protein
MIFPSGIADVIGAVSGSPRRPRGGPGIDGAFVTHAPFRTLPLTPSPSQEGRNGGFSRHQIDSPDPQCMSAQCCRSVAAPKPVMPL